MIPFDRNGSTENLTRRGRTDGGRSPPPAPAQVQQFKLILSFSDQETRTKALLDSIQSHVTSLMAQRQLREGSLLVPRKFVLFLQPEHSPTSSWGKVS